MSSALVAAGRRGNLHGGSGSRARHVAVSARAGVGLSERTLNLSAQQYAFVTSMERFAMYVGGRGAGKSFAGALRAIIAAQEQPGVLGLVGAPTFPMLRDAAQRMFAALCPPALIARHIKTEQRTIFHNGSEILWRPAHEFDRYRGLNLGWFWLDEAPWCGYEAWQVLKATLRQEGYATRAWATGTGRGRDGYARDFEFERKAHHALYRASTRANLRNLPAGFIEDLGYTGQFAAQEIEGLFVSFDGLVYAFDGSALGGNVKRWSGRREDFGRVVGGIDWGYTNPCAALVFGLDGDRRAWQLAEFYERRASLEERIVPQVVEMTRRYGVSTWHADSEDPEAIDRLRAALAREGLSCHVRPAVKGAGSVRAGIQTVTSLLALRGDGTRGLYVDPECANTIAEYGAYAYERRSEESASSAGRRDPSEQPLKQGDHAMDATRYALHAELAGAIRTSAYLEEMKRWAAWGPDDVARGMDQRGGVTG